MNQTMNQSNQLREEEESEGTSSLIHQTFEWCHPSSGDNNNTDGLDSNLDSTEQECDAIFLCLASSREDGDRRQKIQMIPDRESRPEENHPAETCPVRYTCRVDLPLGSSILYSFIVCGKPRVDPTQALVIQNGVEFNHLVVGKKQRLNKRRRAKYKKKVSSLRQELLSVQAQNQDLIRDLDDLKHHEEPKKQENDRDESCKDDQGEAKKKQDLIIAQLRQQLEQQSQSESTSTALASAAIPEKLSRLQLECRDLHESLAIVRTLCSSLFSEFQHTRSSLEQLFVTQHQIHEDELEDLRLKYKSELVQRRKCFHLLQEARGNLRVYCRVRPEEEEEHDTTAVLSVHEDETEIQLETQVTKTTTTHNPNHHLNQNPKTSRTKFTFDRVFQHQASAGSIFSSSNLGEVVTSVMDGMNATVLAYGQTGSGKSHTMIGSAFDRGLYFRALDHLFREKHTRESTLDYDYTVTISMFEIYNETVRDLFGLNTTSKTLDIRRQASGGMSIPGLNEVSVENLEQVESWMSHGESRRKVGVTDMNAHSSRSHCVFSVNIRGMNTLANVCVEGKLHLIDLAGSERISKSGVTGDRLKEAQAINKSLSALGDVIQALAKKQKHVPFRNSKLTFFLSDSLNSNMLMFLCVRPGAEHSSETSCSLKFGQRAQTVEFGPVKRNSITRTV